MINAGMSCQLIHYTHEEHDKFFEIMARFDAIVVRCNPGQIKADGGDQGKFDDGMREIRKLGINVWPSPDVMEFMGAKDALVHIKDMHIGLPDTNAYYTPEEFSAGFKKTMAFQPRVIKQNRGSAGEGIWIIKLKSGDYCKAYGDKLCSDSDVLDLMEANDNHAEEHTVAEFIEWCLNGRSSKAGTWTSKGVGKYLEGGKAAGGQLVDQRFCPRISEGELRYNLIGDELIGIIHKKPKEGGISAVGGTGSIYTYYGPKEKKFATLTKFYLGEDIKKVMPALGLGDEPLPLWWTTDFINSSPPGTKTKDEKWIVGEFNYSCVGISKCLPAYCKDDTPNACWTDIPKKDMSEVKKLGDLMGKKAILNLNKVANQPEFGYWKIRGLAAPCRMMLAYGGVKYKENQYAIGESPDWFKDHKPELLKTNPLVNLPYIKHGNKVITQTNAVMMYIAKLARLGGKADPSMVEMLLCDVYDLRNNVIDMVYWFKSVNRTVGEFNKNKATFIEEKVKPFMVKYEAMLTKGGKKFFCGMSPTAADFHIFEMLDQTSMMAKDFGKPSPMEGFPKVQEFYDNFKALPKLQSYFNSDAYKLPCNNPPLSFWNTPGQGPPSGAPK